LSVHGCLVCDAESKMASLAVQKAVVLTAVR
jgi:hypothetical protein